MAERKKTMREDPARKGGKDPSPLDKGFDRWLNRQLHGFYDPVLNESVPDDIAKLLEQFDSKDGPAKKSEPGDEGQG